MRKAMQRVIFRALSTVPPEVNRYSELSPLNSRQPFTKTLATLLTSAIHQHLALYCSDQGVRADAGGEREDQRSKMLQQ